MFKVCGIIGISNIVFFIFLGLKGQNKKLLTSLFVYTHIILNNLEISPYSISKGAVRKGSSQRMEKTEAELNQQTIMLVYGRVVVL